MVEGPVDEINVIVTRRDSEERSGYSFRGRVIVGRDEACDLRLQDRLVSRRHAIFSRTESGSVSVRDLNSSNGTVVNGRDLRGAEATVVGDTRVELGPYVILVSPGDEGTLLMERDKIAALSGDDDEAPEAAEFRR